MEKVSVIVPTYQRNEYIMRAIDSILMQDYESIEIIIVDDNGKNTKNQKLTEQKLSPYIKAGKIRYLCNEQNVGGALARNQGIVESTGTYITFLDDDDEYLQGKISKQLQYMQAHNLDLCVMDGETYDNKGQCLSHKTQPLRENMTQEEILKAHILQHITGTNVFMYRRAALISIGMFDEIPAGQEYLLMQKSITRQLKIGCLHEVLVHFHMDGQARISTRLSKVEGLKLVFEEKRKYFHLLSHQERAHIKAKHHGTLFYMYYINHKYIRAIWEMGSAVLCSPRCTWETYQERKGKLKSR